MTDKPIFTPEQEKKMLKFYSLGATDWQVHHETGFMIEDICKWRAQGENNALIVKHQSLPPWRAKKVLHDPKTFEEAKWLATHHPEMKTEYGERIDNKTELTFVGKSDEELQKRAAEIIGEIIN